MADISADSLPAAPARSAAATRIRLSPELATGLLFLAAGTFFAFFGLDYRVGTMRSMGPGMFPVAGGVILAVLGLVLVLRNYRNTEALPAFAGRTLFAVLGSVVAFALTVDSFGLAVAAPLLIAGAVLATGQGNLKLLLALAIPLTVGTIIVFPYLLGVPLKVLP